MELQNGVVDSLLHGLSRDDQTELMQSMDKARNVQLEATRHPRRRRRRNEDGELEPLESEHTSFD
jgi:hypothetical protein